MRVVVREAFKAYINHQPEDFAPGQKIKGDTAVYLLSNKAPVDPEDDEARELAESLEEDKDEDADGQEQEQPSANPDGSSPSPEPPGELDIDTKADDVLAWVGDDPERAKHAIEAEQAKDKPRSTLVKQLAKIAGE